MSQNGREPAPVCCPPRRAVGVRLRKKGEGKRFSRRRRDFFQQQTCFFCPCRPDGGRATHRGDRETCVFVRDGCETSKTRAHIHVRATDCTHTSEESSVSCAFCQHLCRLTRRRSQRTPKGYEFILAVARYAIRVRVMAYQCHESTAMSYCQNTPTTPHTHCARRVCPRVRSTRTRAEDRVDRTRADPRGCHAAHVRRGSRPRAACDRPQSSASADSTWLVPLTANRVAREEESRSDLQKGTRAARSKGARASKQENARGHHEVKCADREALQAQHYGTHQHDTPK